MIRFISGFVAALVSLVAAILVLPVDVSVRAQSARDTPSMVPEVSVPLAEWCREEAALAIASSGLFVEIQEVARNSSHYPFVTGVARISKVENSVMSEASSRAANELANQLMRICLPQSYLEIRGPNPLDQVIEVVRKSGITNGKSWFVLEVGPDSKAVTLSRVPDFPPDALPWAGAAKQEK